MLDKKRLEIALLEKDITKKVLAEKLNISKTTLYRKINGESDFFYNELQIISSLLGKEYMDSIFFAEQVT